MPNSPVCIDASVVVALVTAEAQSEQALALWSDWMQRDIRVAAPALLPYEVTSALWRKAVRGRMSVPDARRALHEALSLDIELISQSDLCPRAFDLAARFNRPSAYDTCYLAVAETLGGEFWTADQKLYNAVSEGFPRIRLLRD